MRTNAHAGTLTPKYWYLAEEDEYALHASIKAGYGRFGVFPCAGSSSRNEFIAVKLVNLNNRFVVVLNWFDELDRLTQAGK